MLEMGHFCLSPKENRITHSIKFPLNFTIASANQITAWSYVVIFGQIVAKGITDKLQGQRCYQPYYIWSQANINNGGWWS